MKNPRRPDLLCVSALEVPDARRGRLRFARQKMVRHVRRCYMSLDGSAAALPHDSLDRDHLADAPVVIREDNNRTIALDNVVASDGVSSACEDGEAIRWLSSHDLLLCVPELSAPPDQTWVRVAANNDPDKSTLRLMPHVPAFSAKMSTEKMQLL